MYNDQKEEKVNRKNTVTDEPIKKVESQLTNIYHIYSVLGFDLHMFK